MARKSGAFDLNRCTVRQLVQLSGIPLAHARKLVRFRERQRRRAHLMEEERIKLRAQKELSGPESHRLLLSVGEDDGHRHSGRSRLGTQCNPFVIVLEFRQPTDGLHRAVELRRDAKDPRSPQIELEDTKSQYSLPEHFIYTDNQRRQGPCGLALENQAQPEQPDHPSRRAEGSPEPVPPPGPALLTPQDLSHPHPVFPEEAYRPAAVPCQAALEAGIGQWIKEARCKICGALERCWAKLRRRYTQRRHSTAELLQNRRISVEVKRRGRRRRRREKRGEKLRNHRDREMAEWAKPGQGAASNQQCIIQ